MHGAVLAKQLQQRFSVLVLACLPDKLLYIMHAVDCSSSHVPFQRRGNPVCTVPG
jgi:hypothetical protein